MTEVLKDILVDTAKMLPVLLAVYLLIELFEHHTLLKPGNAQSNRKFGPAMGAISGLIPQCGVAAAGAALYNTGAISTATLIALFLATSDEAIPILLAEGTNLSIILQLIICKLAIGLLAGYGLSLTVFAKESLPIYNPTPAKPDCHHSKAQLLGAAICHTLKTAFFIAVSMVFIALIWEFLGTDRLSAFLLRGNLLQPILTGVIGLIPGCGTSILLVQLYLAGTLTFGSTVAGLSAGAGVGYIVLFQGAKSKGAALKILIWTLLISVTAGILLDLLSR